MIELKLIRGKRILQQMIHEASWNVLDTNTRTKMPHTDRREHITPRQQVQSLTLIPAVPSNVLKIESTVKGETNSYNCVIQFDNVQYEDSETNENIEIVGSDNKPYYIKPILLLNNNAKVFCNCLDFRWRFAIWNHGHNSLYGNPPPPYSNKTQRQPVNPQKVPGVCKHLLRVMEVVSESGLVK